MEKKQIRRGIKFVIGYILSPLSFWNDLFVNIPLAYILSFPLYFINKSLWLIAFVIAYWFTNWLGFYLMGDAVMENRDKKLDLIASVGYTIVVVILAYLGIIPNPKELIEELKKLKFTLP